MNRAEGLVQRRPAAAQTNSGGSKSNGVDEEGNGAAADYENDADSKDTRLTLMEEVLLLGLKDKEVRNANEIHLSDSSNKHI